MQRLLKVVFPAALLFFCLMASHAHALSARINNVSDLTFPDWSLGSGDLNGSIDMCIFASGLLGGHTYTVTVSGTGLVGFAMANGLNFIPITLSWEDSGSGHLGSSTGTQLLNTIPLLGQQNGAASDNNCGGQPNARLYAKVLAADMTAALSGTYQCDLFILIAPI